MIDPVNLALSAVVFFVYSVACIVSVIFTLSLDTYRKIDEKMRLDLISSRIINPLDINIDWLDTFLMSNNKTVGPLLILLSTIDLKLLFNIIYTF
jgi:hypothetical protein